MSDGAVFWLIALALFGFPAIVQLLLCVLAKSRIIKMAPSVFVGITWIVCVLGSYNVIDLPQTSTLANGGFIAFYDYTVIAMIGIAVLLGIGFAWLSYGVIMWAKKKA
ncbi:hypothetical protein Desde_3615 [Desulfitobacterium dehalogenans ATCC 51507]|uniref:Uncharacterized protein n=2 Tax=Desulfitobacteriaceae TaxID=2937909 RepID=I4AD54_DESDJ|nr:hypothetical protein Desde_3615 [Desulfitobacterium dehalogenans ATCC 51507]